tara:strand:+ start:416 stop:1927 length:1512 start_codon:yes stop_codon:yes gene_type:complete
MDSEKNILFADFKILNDFLYKYFLINLLINFYLFIFPGIFLPLILYTFSIIVFLIRFSKIYKNFYFCFFSQIFAIFIVNLSYLNFILSVIINEFYLNQNFQNILKFYYFSDLKSYFLANSYLIFFSIIVMFFNSFINFTTIEKSINKLKTQNLYIDLKKNYFLIILCLIIEFAYFFSGALGTQLTGAFIVDDPSDQATWYTHFYYFIVTFHLLLNMLLLKNRNKSAFGKKILLISFILNFVFYGFFLRRMAVQFLFVAIIVYFMLSNIKIKKIKFFILNVILVSLVFQFTNFLQSIRSSEIYSIKNNQTMIEVVREGNIFKYFTNQDLRREAREISIENISKRIFTNHELATIFYHEKNSVNKYLYGKLIRNHLIFSTPKAIFPNKNDYPISEILISTTTDSPLYNYDTVDSLQSFSYVDFGIFGLILYPILLVILFYIFYTFINYKKINSLTSLLILMLFIPSYSLRVVELNISDWFVLIRNIIIFILIFNYLLTSKKFIKN